MFSKNRLYTKLMAIFPALLLGAIFVLSNAARGACGAPGGC